MPVSKAAGAGDPSAPPVQLGGDDLPWVYAGTFVVRGQGYAQVTATGGRSQVGRIGRSLGQLQLEPTPLQQQTARLVKVLAGIALVLCLTLVLILGLRTASGCGRCCRRSPWPSPSCRKSIRSFLPFFPHWARGACRAKAC